MPTDGIIVEIDDKPYIIKNEEEFNWQYAENLGVVFRDSGVATPQDNQIVTRFPYRWTKGLFWRRMRRETGRGVDGVSDANAETRFDSMTLPLNPQAVSANLYSGDGEEFQSGYSRFNSGLWCGIHSTNSASNPARVGSVKYGATSDNFTAGDIDILGLVADNDDYARDFAMIVHGDSLFILFGVDDNSANTERYYIYDSLDGITWNDARGEPDAPFTVDYLTTARLSNNDWRQQFGAMVSFGTKLVIAVKELAASDGGSVDQFRFYSSTDPTGTPAWDLDTTIADTNNQIKMHIWQDHLTVGFPNIPIAVLRTGIFQIVTVGETFATIEDLNGSVGDGLASAVSKGDGRLYVGTADGNILAFGVEELNGLTREDIGPQSYGDGPVTARQGYATYIYGDDPNGLWVAYGGNAANMTASIFFYRFRDKTWHSIYLDTTANREITQLTLSTADDGTMRLHFNTEGTADDVPQMIEQPLVGTSAGVTQQYRDQGVVQFPNDDFGDPNSKAGVFEAIIEDPALSATTSGQYISYATGSDSGLWGTDARGNFLSGTTRLQFVAGTGIEANLMTSELTLERDGTNTNTPKPSSFEVRAINQQDTLRVATLPIDLEATWSRFQRSPEAQIEELEAVFKAATQVDVTIAKFSAFKAKVITPPSATLRVTGNAQEGLEQGYLAGTFPVTLTQIIEGT